MMSELKEYIREFLLRNRSGALTDVYSVTNSEGFVPSTDYFKKEVFSKDLTSYKVVRPGMLAYNPSRINVGSVDCLALDHDVIVSPLYVVFETDRTRLLPEYLNLFLHSSIALGQIKSLTAGSVRDSLKFSALGRLLLKIPTLDQQAELLAKAKAIRNLISSREKQLDKLDQLVKSRFVEMFGDETERDRWPKGTVGDVAEVCVGVVIKPTQYYRDSGVRTFRSLNIGAMFVKDSDWVYFSAEGHAKNQKSVVRKGDVLVVRSGAPGTACVVPAVYDGSNAVDIIIAHPNVDKVDPIFLAMFTNMPHGMNQIRSRTGGAAQQHYNVGGYKELRLSIPPLALQHEFAAFVAEVDKSEFAVRKSLEELQKLYRQQLQEAFG